MYRIFLAVFFCASTTQAQTNLFTPAEVNAWKSQASRVTIYRDGFGVPHIYGKSDADAVFGLLYSQCEDGFERVEMNYITALGRQSELKGEAYVWQDLRARLVIDEARGRALYQSAKPELKKLLDAFAAGINYFIFTHPEVRPKLIQRIEPWMHILFSEGSIGGDITSISLTELEKFYTGQIKVGQYAPEERVDRTADGSNGFALSPSRSTTGNALFYINPHTTFYFRGEFHMVSEEGLNAYGAATWGQLFLYQGFNASCGWMHTSSQADVVDFYKERVELEGKRYMYWNDNKKYPVETKDILLKVLKNGKMEVVSFTGYRTMHGPVVAERDGAWISIAMMDLPMEALTQSFYRTKADGYESYRKTMDIRTNSSNNTVFADNKGHIAYWHGNFMPKRDVSVDWSGDIDGSLAKTTWKGLHEQSEMIHLLNPPEGWIQNCNSNPFTATGKGGLDSLAYPSYMAPDPENYRGIHARKIFSTQDKFSPETLLQSAFDPYLPAFSKLIPSVVSAYEDERMVFDPAFQAPVSQLKNWDYKTSVESQAMTLAMVLARKMQALTLSKLNGRGLDNMAMVEAMTAQLSPLEKIKCLKQAMDELTQKFGTWQVSWGELNRFQRPKGLENIFNDQDQSFPVGLGSGFFGALATFESRPFGTNKWYGVSGNSFVAVVDFGKKVKAKSILVGGQDCLPGSAHFTDQAKGYLSGTFKDVLYYKNDVVKNALSKYKPGSAVLK